MFIDAMSGKLENNKSHKALFTLFVMNFHLMLLAFRRKQPI